MKFKLLAGASLIFSIWYYSGVFIAKMKVANGEFVRVGVPVEGMENPNTVLVVGPNCNRPEGIRAKELADKLTELNIPNRRTDTISYNSESSEIPDTAMLNEVMNGDAPKVFINGKAKANPNVEEVVVEYKKLSAR